MQNTEYKRIEKYLQKTFKNIWKHQKLPLPLHPSNEQNVILTDEN